MGTYTHPNFFYLKVSMGAADMLQLLRAPAVLAEDLSSFPSTHVQLLTTIIVSYSFPFSTGFSI